MVRNGTSRARKKKAILNKNETIYIVPVKPWTWRYALSPEVRRLRAITSALGLRVSIWNRGRGGGGVMPHKVAGNTKTSQ